MSYLMIVEVICMHANDLVRIHFFFKKKLTEKLDHVLCMQMPYDLCYEILQITSLFVETDLVYSFEHQ